MKNRLNRESDQRGVGHIKLILLIILALVLVGVGLIVFRNNGKSNAGSDNYKYLGKVVWNTNQTAYYANSDFYNYACINENTKSFRASVSFETIATSYVSYMKAGRYEPSVATRINGTTNGWGVFWKYGIVQNMNGAYQKHTTRELALNSVFQMGVLRTNYWPTVLTQPIIVRNIKTCKGNQVVLPSSIKTSLTSPLLGSAAAKIDKTPVSDIVNVASARSFPKTGDYYIQIDSEEILVTAGQGTTSWTVTRGINDTQIANHSEGATVSETYFSIPIQVKK